MAWPFTSCAAPTLDTGPGQAVPTSATAISTDTVYLLGLHFINASGAARVVTVTNTAGDIIWQETIAAGSGSIPYSPTFEPTVGLKWSADDSDVLGHVWGY